MSYCSAANWELCAGAGFLQRMDETPKILDSSEKIKKIERDGGEKKPDNILKINSCILQSFSSIDSVFIFLQIGEV